jgi:hypothetical protein
MSIAEGLFPEFDQEMATTRKLLARVPSDKEPWKPHPKSFLLGHLAQLVATMPGWLTKTLRDTEINMSIILIGKHLPGHAGVVDSHGLITPPVRNVG